MRAPPESVGWQGKCQVMGDQTVEKVSAESLGWRGKCQATENFPGMRATPRVSVGEENVRRREIGLW